MNEQKEIQLKKVYYFKMVEAGKNLISSIQHEIDHIRKEHGANPIYQAPYRLAKLHIELIEAEMAQAYHEDYFNHYNDRCEKHDTWFKEQSDECNEGFESMLDKARHAMDNPKLRTNGPLMKVLTGCLEMASDSDNINDQSRKNDIFKILKDNLKDISI